MATPTWCLLSSAYTVALWLLIYLIVDLGGFRTGSNFLAQAGKNALFAYILAPMVTFLVLATTPLLGGFNIFAYLSEPLAVGIIRSAVFAVLLTWLAGYLKGFGVNPKL